MSLQSKQSHFFSWLLPIRNSDQSCAKKVHGLHRAGLITRAFAWVVGPAICMVWFAPNWSNAFWLGFIFSLCWPLIAFILAVRADRPFDGEKRSMIVDSLLCGFWLALLGYHPIMWFVIIGGRLSSDYSLDGYKLALRGLFLMTVGALLTSSVIGFNFYFNLEPVIAFTWMGFSAAFSLVMGYIVRLANLRLKKNRKQLELANADVKIKNEQLENLAYRLSKYLPKPVYQTIFSGQQANISSQEKYVTVCFTDICNFTEIAESKTPQQLTTWLNDYLNAMVNIVNEYSGTLDKIIGDSLMVFFGDPYSEGLQQDAISTVNMAVAMQKESKRRGIKLRIGINSGMMTVGNFGAGDRMEYTIIGKNVNLASRLENNAQEHGILMSAATQELVCDYLQVKPVGELQLKGIKNPVMSYTIDN